MKKIFSLSLIAVLCFLLLLPAVFASGTETYVIDESGLLTLQERAELEAQAEQIAASYQCGVYILTVDSLDGKPCPEYAEDYSDENYLGYGNTDDCILLVVCLNEREFGFTGTGVGYYVLTDDVKADLEDALAEGLGAGNYAQTFSSFLSTCGSYIPEARQWEASAQEEIDDSEVEREPQDTTGRTVAGAVAAPALGFLFSGIPVSSMKRKNSNVSKKRTATNYAAENGINFSVCEDRFLRTNTTRVHITPSDSGRGSSGGSMGVGGGHITSHTSSSGVTHSSGGGKF